jgi:hypothetical protein
MRLSDDQAFGVPARIGSCVHLAQQELHRKQQIIHYRPREVLMAAKKGRRTTHRSVTGTKLYAVRDAKGRFLDIQTYKRAHAMDIKRKSRKEKKRK